MYRINFELAHSAELERVFSNYKMSHEYYTAELDNSYHIQSLDRTA